MDERKLLDDDIPPTRAEDWIGAARVSPGDDAAPEGGKELFVFKSSNDAKIFVVVDNSNAELPECPEGEWKLFTKFPITGQPRIGFSESAALIDIEKHGYHLGKFEIRSDIGVS